MFSIGKKGFKFAFALLGLTTSLVFSSALPSKTIAKNVHADSQTVSAAQFVRIDNFLYSNLGIQIEFTFELPQKTSTNTFSLLDKDWHRLTDYLTMSFKTNGDVSASVGNVFKVGDKYFYQLMCSELTNYLNKGTGEVAYGTETIEMMYINDCQVSLNIANVSIINCELNAHSEVEMRQDYPYGLKFKAHLPILNETSKYGMIITPYQYVAKMQDDFISQLKSNYLKYIDLECNPKPVVFGSDIYKAYGNGYYIQGSIVDIKEQNFQIEFCSIPYELDKNNVYHYGNFHKLTKATLYDVLLKEKNSGIYNSYDAKTKQFADYVVNSCEKHATNLSTSNVKAYFAYNTQQVRKEDALPSNLMTNVLLQSGKNEKESAQVILNFASSGKKKYYVTFEPFVHTTNTDYKIPSSAVSIYKENYVNVATNWVLYADQTGPCYHDGNEELPLGWYPDSIVPFDLAINNQENYLTSENGSNNGIYFSIKVPETALAGNYTSKIVIRILDEGTIAMPVNLKVNDFTLPSENHSKYTIQISTQELGYVYENKNDYTGKEKAFYKSGFEFMANRGIGAQLPAVSWQKSDLPAYMQEAKKWAVDDRLGAYFLPIPYDLMSFDCTYQYEKKSFLNTTIKSSTVNFKNWPFAMAKDYFYEDAGKIQMYGLETLFAEIVKASTNECNIFKKGILYLPQADEPGNDEASCLQNILIENTIRRSKETVLGMDIFDGKEEVRDALIDLGYIVTARPNEMLNGKVKSISSIENCTSFCKYAYLSNANDIKQYKITGYCPMFNSFDYHNGGSNDYGYQDLMTMLDDDNYTIWWYGCCIPVGPYPVNWTNSPMIRYRVNKWWQFNLGIEGELYYMCNRACSVLGGEDSGAIYEPKTEEQILAGETTYNGAYGEGSYMYPVHDKYKDIDNEIYWLSSLRLENLSEANDDYNYLYYAEELISKLPSEEQQEMKERVLDCITSLTTGPYYNTTNHSLFYNQKGVLSSILAELE